MLLLFGLAWGFSPTNDTHRIRGLLAPGFSFGEAESD